MSSAAANRRLYEVFGLKIREVARLFGLTCLSETAKKDLPRKERPLATLNQADEGMGIRVAGVFPGELTAKLPYKRVPQVRVLGVVFDETFVTDIYFL